MTILIEVPRGLNGVAVTDTTIGDVLGAEGRYHYRGHDAIALGPDPQLRGGLAPRRRRPSPRRR